MLKIKKRIPEQLTKWEKENNVYGYSWQDTTVTNKSGETIVTDSCRKYALTRFDGAIEIPDEIRKYFKPQANAGNKDYRVKEIVEPQQKKGREKK
jgi:methyltransferase-like protein